MKRCYTCYKGLSPRVRGNQVVKVRLNSFEGSIPACTGEPCTSHRHHRTREVYPRVYGGTNSGGSSKRSVRGLSPRVRGNLFDRSSDCFSWRSIPACTGEPGRLTAVTDLPSVYPRVYGGTDEHGQIDQFRPGLSPRVRGNPTWAAVLCFLYRSIPACTGEPWSAAAQARSAQVYPRVYGGTLPAFSAWVKRSGLSPRVRGNLCDLRIGQQRPGSIPACTGEPPGRNAGLRTAGVYPRVYGGTRERERRRQMKIGLSPRVRGNPARLALALIELRSIPACTGEPSCPASQPFARRVYPRVYGGTSRTPSSSGC